MNMLQEQNWKRQDIYKNIYLQDYHLPFIILTNINEKSFKWTWKAFSQFWWRWLTKGLLVTFDTKSGKCNGNIIPVCSSNSSNASNTQTISSEVQYLSVSDWQLSSNTHEHNTAHSLWRVLVFHGIIATMCNCVYKFCPS